MTEQLTEAQRRLLEIVDAHQYVTGTTLAALLGRDWQNQLWSCMQRGWIESSWFESIGDVGDDIRCVRVFRLTRAGRRVLLGDDYVGKKGGDGIDGDIIRIIVHEVFEAYDSDNHYDDYESLRRKLEAAGVSDAWERDIDSDLKSARDIILGKLGM